MLLVVVDLALDPTFRSDSKHVAVDVARRTMKEYRNIHSHPFQVRRRWNWGSCSHRHHTVRTIRGTPIQGIENESERDIVLVVDDEMLGDEVEGASPSKKHAHNSQRCAVDGDTHHDDGVVVVVVHLGTLVHPRTAN